MTNNPSRYAVVLRGCRAIAGYYYNDEEQWRKINNRCKSGRFPHYREGKGGRFCAFPAIIDRWVHLQVVFSMQGKTLGPKDIMEHFGFDIMSGKDDPSV